MLVAAKITLTVLLFILVEMSVTKLEVNYFSKSNDKLVLKLVEALGLSGVFVLSMILLLG
jgi:hypothetical protein